ncbi:MAG: hypothetical protein FJX20_15940 [Alphaproteobacteria bacterium]|nr:hypothetical protein [Alphaproteobacteria bacterium]
MVVSPRLLVPPCLIGVGLVILLANAIALTGWGVYVPKLFAISPILILLGMAMLLFPGAAPPPDLDQQNANRHYWKAAPRAHKAAWFVAAAIGLALGILGIDYLGYFDR